MDKRHQASVWRPQAAPFAFCLGALLTFAGAAQADDVPWSNFSGGNFQSGGNWVGGSAPGPTDTAVFDLASAGYVVDFSGDVLNERLFVATDIVTFDLSGFTYTLADLEFPASSPLRIGELSDDNGSLTIFDGVFDASGITVAVSGQGYLEINDAAQVTTGVPSHIASLTGSIADVLVTGLGSSWTMTDHLIIGQSGTGSLTVDAGGAVATTWCVLGNVSDGDGTLTVTGGSTFTFNDALVAGLTGQGTIVVDNGGEITSAGGSGFFTVGNDGVGNVTVMGTGSLIDATGHPFLVGFLDEGNVTVSAGAHLTTGFPVSAGGVGGFVGDDPGGDGEVTITGVGSEWTTNQQIQVGHDGAIGVVRVQNGGYLESNKDTSASSTSGIIGFDNAANPPGSGTVIVEDSGSSWVNDGTINVGWNDTGTLEILAGGDVFSADGVIGRLAGALGSTTVDGAGSTWTISNSLAIGGTTTSSAGAGAELVLTNSGSVSVQNLVKLWPDGVLHMDGGSLTVLTGAIDSDGLIRGRSSTISADVTSTAGIIAPGLPLGILTLDGDYTQDAGAQLEIEIGGTTVGTQYDRLVVTGTANLDGLLTLTERNAFAPSAGQTFQVMSYGALEGTFADVDWPGVAFDIRYESNGVFLDVLANAPVAALAPYNVGMNRYLAFQPNNGATPVAFEVTRVGTGVIGWVSAPDANGISGIVASAVTRVWPESVVLVGSCGIAPGASYEVHASGDGGGSFSTALAISTAATWGDINGVSGANVIDIALVLESFRRLTTAPPVPKSDVDPHWPNKSVNMVDVLQVTRGVSGFAYPFASPTCSSCNCQSNEDCDDLTFCNGAERCIDCTCTSGVAPCAGVCNEGNDTCDGAGPSASIATISLVPVSATVSHSINGNEITFNNGGYVYVTLNVRIDNWDSDLNGSPKLGAFQATLDPDSFLGVNANPANPGVDLYRAVAGCTVNADCTTLFGSPSLCRPPAEIFGCTGGNCCEPAFVQTTLPDYAFAGNSTPGSSGRRTIEAALVVGNAIMPTTGGIADSGSSKYAGTFVVEVPAEAEGTYTVEFDRETLDTFLAEEGGDEISTYLIPTMITVVATSPILYVDIDATGADNGSSWTDAFESLQDALAEARTRNTDVDGGNDISEIWVAVEDGTYYADAGDGITPGDRTASFELVSGVALRGGFAGTETDLIERPPGAQSDLSGAIGAAGAADNSYHVVKAEGTGSGTLLDGFQIFEGNANGSGDSGNGGGLFMTGGTLIVNDCQFFQDQAARGGGIYVNGGALTINSSTIQDSGATDRGGGLFSIAQSLEVIGSEFDGNSAVLGGGLYLTGGDAIFRDCTFSFNTALDGGGVFIDQINSAPAFNQCIFTDNVASNHGASAYSRQANPRFINGILVTTFGAPLSNLYVEGTTSPVVINSVLWGISPFEISGDVSALVTYSDVEGGYAGTGNIDEDPLFVALSSNLRLQAGSPCIDAGDSTAVVTAVDLGGNPRRYDSFAVDTGAGPLPIVDMGAFEFFDCNENAVPDDQDILNLTSNDCNSNNLPDECEPQDCDGDNIPDACEALVAQGDCDNDGICNGVEITNCVSDPDCDDCNANGTPDACDLAQGADDCTAGTGVIFGQGVPDICEDDCNSNTIADSCDILANAFDDCNIDGILDSCQTVNCCDADIVGNWSDPGVWGCGEVCQTRYVCDGGFNDTNECDPNQVNPDADCEDGMDDGVCIEDGQSCTIGDGMGLARMGQPTITLDVDITADTTRVLSDAVLNITGASTGDLTLEAAGGLLVLGEVNIANDRSIDASAGQVTIGPGGLYRKAPAAGATSASLSADLLTITAGTPTETEGTVELTDTMSVTTNQLVLDGRNADPACDQAARGGIHPPPNVGIRKSALVNVSEISLLGTVSVTVGSIDPQETQTPTITLSGDFKNTSKDPCLFNWYSGELVLDGGTLSDPITFEVAGRDLGAVPSGFMYTEGALRASGPVPDDRNFSIPELTIAKGSAVEIVSEVANTAPAVGPCVEALYAGTLTLGPGCNVVIADTVVYYATLIDEGGNVQTVGCGGLVPLPTCATSVDCDDGFYCTGDEQCQDITGQVVQGDQGICEPPPNPCGTQDVCDESGSRCLLSAAPSSPQTPSAQDPARGRFLGMVLPASGAGRGVGQETALQVRLTSLHHPSSPPPGSPSFAGSEGQVRYVRAFRDGSNNPIYDCPDSASLGTSFKCATLGCDPEYRDWSSIFNGSVVYISGASVVPSSTYDVAQLGLICEDDETGCPTVSAEFRVSTGRWGDVDPGTLSAIDIGKLVDKAKDIPTALPRHQAQLQPHVPVAIYAVSALDIGHIVNAVKALPYPFAGPETCP